MSFNSIEFLLPGMPRITKRPSGSPTIIYLTIVSSIIGIGLLVINFRILPELMKIVEISSVQAEVMRARFFQTAIGALIFLFLINFCFWNLNMKFNKEEREVQNSLKINPNDPFFQERLNQIETRRQRNSALIEPIFMLALGAIIGFIALTFIGPILRLIYQGY